MPACLQVAFVVIRLLLRRSTATALLWVGWILMASLQAACYHCIAGALGASSKPPAARVLADTNFVTCLTCSVLPAAPHTCDSMAAGIPASSPTRPPAAPVYDAAGALVYAGADLSTGGVLSYFHDVRAGGGGGGGGCCG